MSLRLIMGPMFAGKTTKIIELLSNPFYKNMKSLNINYSKNNRYGTDENITHDGNKINTTYKVKIEKLNNIVFGELYPYYKQSDLIIIDECQFYEDLFSFVNNGINIDKKHFICAGLNGDSDRKIFGKVYQLLPIVDSIYFIKGKCECGKESLFSKRIINDSNQICIGDNTSYKPVCRDCYNLNNVNS